MIYFFLIAFLTNACNQNSDNVLPVQTIEFIKDEKNKDTIIKKYIDTAAKSIEDSDIHPVNGKEEHKKPAMEILNSQKGEEFVESPKDTRTEELLEPIIEHDEKEDLPEEGSEISIELKDIDTKSNESPQEINIMDHSSWDVLLSKYVNAKGQVNYKGLLKEIGALDNYLNELSQNPPTPSWTKNEEFAYWINAYNAFTVKLILTEYPVKSIMDIENGKAWDKRWIKIGQDKFTLNEIEKNKLIKRFNDPRIHFAVNCAARSCPPILNKAWTKNNLEAQLEQRASLFINDSEYNQLSPETIKISKIFDWYTADFGNLIDYFNQYSSVKIQDNAKIEYIEYDWSLNN